MTRNEFDVFEDRLKAYSSAAPIVQEVREERAAQGAKWGQQNHPNGTGKPGDRELADAARSECEAAFAAGDGNWRDILLEEVCEAFAESDPAALRTELVQVAAVAVAWVEAIDRAAS